MRFRNEKNQNVCPHSLLFDPTNWANNSHMPPDTPCIPQIINLYTTEWLDKIPQRFLRIFQKINLPTCLYFSVIREYNGVLTWSAVHSREHTNPIQSNGKSFACVVQRSRCLREWNVPLMSVMAEVGAWRFNSCNAPTLHNTVLFCFSLYKILY